VLLGAFHFSPGWSRQTIDGGACTVRRGTLEQSLNLIRSATIPTSGDQTFPRLPALALVRVVHRPLSPLGADNSPQGELIDQIRLRAGTLISNHVTPTYTRSGQRPSRPPAGADLTLLGQSHMFPGAPVQAWLAWASIELSNHVRVLAGML